MRSMKIGGLLFTTLAASCAADDHGDLATLDRALAGYSSHPPYLVPLQANVSFEALLTVGDSDAKGEYRMAAIPDGLGAWGNGSKVHLLMNHEMIITEGAVRDHGFRGAFVSRWRIDKDTREVEHGSDLIQQVALWDHGLGQYAAPATGVPIHRLCSADLPPPSALSTGGLGHDGRLFMSGEEADSGAGRGFAHDVDTGISYELPRLGRMGFENIVVRPASTVSTVAVATDDGSPNGEVVVYAGTKTAVGLPPERAGFTNGVLYGLVIPGYPRETTAGVQLPPPAPGTPITFANLGDVTALSKDQLQALQTANGVTVFDRPEDVHWNPANPDQVLFVTTATMTRSTRLWRVTFVDGSDPALGATIEVVADGNALSVGGVTPRMWDNMTVTADGRWAYLQEDTGNIDYLSKVWRYDLVSGDLQLLAQHDPARFIPGGATFMTRDEESSGIIDASALLGPGRFILTVQAHTPNPDPELVQYGQLLIMTVAD